MGTVIQLGMDEALRLIQDGEKAEYDAFTEKFKPKKTTDDCYTPPNIYDAVLGWVRAEYSLGDAPIVRPFFPGMDYTQAAYPPDCVVVDNPPFSILTQIVRWYVSHAVRFFLFAPALTLFVGRGLDISYICVDGDITYANGANVRTAFVTNLDACRLRTAPDLDCLIRAEDEKNRRAATKELPKYSYPDEIVTAALLEKWSHYGVDFRVPKDECAFVPAMDAQRQAGKSIYGGGWLLGADAAAERAAAERAAAERAAATRWPLSDRERALTESLRRKKED